MKHIIVCLFASVLATAAAAADCDVVFDCPAHRATIDGKTYPIVCGHSRHGWTGRGIAEGTIGHLIRASGPWRPGLVAPGTPMITTSPQLCFDCFIHVSAMGFSNGCLGTTAAAFNALKACAGSAFFIAPIGK